MAGGRAGVLVGQFLNAGLFNLRFSVVSFRAKSKSLTILNGVSGYLSKNSDSTVFHNTDCRLAVSSFLNTRILIWICRSYFACWITVQHVR
jgi:hypothetical protein